MINCLHCQAPLLNLSNKFCNNSCATKHNNVLRPKKIIPTADCVVCNKSFQLKNRPDQKCCSRQCHAKLRTKNTPEIIRANRNETSARYRANLRNQTPPTADRAAIKQFYANCPPGYEVDHIIPISRGGLHVLENLQYLTITENRRKSNKLA